MRAVGGQDDHLDPVVPRGAVERLVQGVEQGGVLGVAAVGPVQDDARDARGRRLVEDRIVGHGVLPSH